MRLVARICRTLCTSGTRDSITPAVGDQHVGGGRGDGDAAVGDQHVSGGDWELMVRIQDENEVEDKWSQLNCSCFRNAVGQVAEEEGSHQVSKIKIISRTILWSLGPWSKS